MARKKNPKNSEVGSGVKQGIVGGLLSSLCCIGPLIIVLLGLGTISFALSISRYRPLFLSLGILFFLGAVYLHLSRKNKTCKTNYMTVEGIKKEKNFIISLAVSMLVVYLLTLYLIVPALSPSVYQGRGAIKNPQKSSSAKQLNTNPDLRVLNLKIDGMTCNGCSSGIQAILEGMPGVRSAEISYEKASGKIIYDANTISKEEILSSEAFSGQYSARVVGESNA